MRAAVFLSLKMHPLPLEISRGYCRKHQDLFLGTFAPFFLASERPMAIAWLLLVTFLCFFYGFLRF
jgi:hypothetical protein